MAQVAKMEAVIDLKINDEGIASQVEKAFSNAKKIADKDGIKFKVGVDEAGLVNFTKTLSKINDGKNKIDFTFDKDAFIKSFGSLDKEGIAQVEAFAKKAQDLLNGAFVGGKSGGNSNGALNGNLKSLEQISSQIEQQKKRYGELRQEVVKYASAFKEAEKKSAQGVKDSWNNYTKSDSAKDRKEFVRQFKAFEDNGFNKKLLNGTDSFGEAFDFDKFKQKYEKQLKGLPKSFNVDKEAQKISEQFKLPFDRSQLEEYAKESRQIVAQIKELQKQKQELEKIQKGSQDKKADTNSSGNKNNGVKIESGSKTDSGAKTDSTSHPIKIEPSNLEEFYGKIEGFRTAKINVEVGNKDTVFSGLENKTVKVNVDDDKEQAQNTALKYRSTTSNSSLKEQYEAELEKNNKAGSHNFSSNVNAILKDVAQAREITDKQVASILAYGKSSQEAEIKYQNTQKAKKAEASAQKTGKVPVYKEVTENDVNFNVFEKAFEKAGISVEQFSTAMKDVSARLGVSLNNEIVKKNAVPLSESSLDVIKAENKVKDLGEISTTPIASEGSIAALKKQIEGGINPIEVKLNPINTNELASLVNEQKELLQSPTSPTINSAYTQQEDSLQRILELQKVVNEGNREIAKTTDSTGKLNNPLLDGALAKGNKTTTKKAINNLLKEYDPETSGKEYKDKLAAYVASYKDIGNLQNTSFKKYPELWTEISASIEKATASQKAYEEMLQESAKVKGSDLTKEETQAITDSIKSENLGQVIKDSLTTAEAESSSGIDGLKSSVSDLISTIGTIGTTYQTSVADVSAGADAQVESISKVKTAITELGSSLELVGVKTLEELPQYKEQIAQIQAEQDKLAKEKEALQKLQDKKDNSSKKSSKDKTEELTDIEKLKNAFEKTKGWTLDESSIQKQSNGITTYIAELEKAEGETEKFLLSVGNVNDIITKSGTVNKRDYLNKAQPLSSAVENAATESIKVEGENKASTAIEKTVDDITRLKEIASNTIGFNLDESSIVKADNGIISFKANLNDADGKIKELNYEIESFSRVVNGSSGGFTDKFLGRGKTDDELKSIEEQKKVLEAKTKQAETLNKLNSAADKTDNFVLNSSSIDSEGFVRFSGYVEEANGKVKELSFSVKELESILGANGGLSSNFIDQANLTKIEETLTKFKAQTAENKTKEAVGIDNTEGLEKARQLEAQINELIASGNVSEEQRKATILEITNAKAKEAELYKVSDSKNYSAQQSVETAKKNYNNILSGIDFSNINAGATIFDKMSNEVVSVKDKMESLKATAAGLVDELSKGEFADKGVFVQTKKSLQETLTAMKELGNNPVYQQTNKKGQTFWQTMFEGQNFNTMATKDVEKGLNKSLSQTYQRVLKNTKFNASNKTATATVLNNGNVEKVTMSLNAYTDAAGRAQVAVHKLNTDEGTYVTSGQKWVDGIKGKIASLSQYVTGLTLVMSAWSKVKEGFSFVQELDSSLTTINQTMSATKDQLSELGQGSIDAGKNLGSSAQDVLNAAAIYANANETTESILEKAKPTVMLANASGADVSTASDQIQGVVNQFKELEGQEQRVVNSYEKISAGLAIDFAKLLAHKLEIIY